MTACVLKQDPLTLKRLNLLGQLEYKLRIFGVSFVLNSGDDELMLNVLRCHLTY